MRYIEYIGAVGINLFRCFICDKLSKFKYLKFPHPAIIKLMPEDRQVGMEICRKCAKREIGSKSKYKWDKLHEKE
jgi:hypothetical protein